MKENENQISRKQFLKLSAVAGVAAFMPKEIIENKELQQIEYPKIIDNIGIKSGNEILDVFVDKDLMRKNIMNKANIMLDPKGIEVVEERLNKLSVSFGARDYYETISNRIDRNEDGLIEFRDTIKDHISGGMKKYFDSGKTPLGSSILDSKNALIYINIPVLYKEDYLKFVWDHEVGHLITTNNHEGIENNSIKNLKKALMAFGISTSASASSTIILSKILSSIKKEDMFDYIKNNSYGLTKIFAIGTIGYMGTSMKYTDNYYYDNVDNDEKVADDIALYFPTPDREFNKMIDIVPRT